MSQPKKSEISERFILYRKRAGLNQQQLAEVLGISNDYVSLIETGQREPGAPLMKLFTLMEADQNRQMHGISDSVGSPMVLKEVGPSPVPTPADCARYLEAYLKTCRGDLGKIAWVYHELKNRFPISLEKTAQEHAPGAEAEFEQHGGEGLGRTSRKSRRGQDTSQASTVPPAPDPQDQKKPHS